MERGKYWILNQMTCIVFVSHDHHHHCFQEPDGEYLSSIKDPTKIINICYDFIVNFKIYLLIERMEIIMVNTITIKALRAVPKRPLIEYLAVAYKANDASPYGQRTNYIA